MVSTQQLTQFAESAPSIEVPLPSLEGQLNKFTNPYDEMDMTKVLTRAYKVAEFTWTALQTEGTEVARVLFPIALYNIPNIAAKLEQFEWLRADVEVTVKINATEFHNGCLMISTMPHYSGVGDERMEMHEQRTQSQNVTLLPASSVNSVTVLIQRCGPRMYDQAHDLGEGQIGIIVIDVFHPLLNVSGTAPSDVTVSVFANFKDPHVAGYGVTPISSAEIKSKLKRLKQKAEHAEKHSKTSAKEGQQKSKAGVTSGIGEAIKSFSPLLMATPFAEFAPIAGIAGQFLSSMGLDKPNDVRAPQPIRDDYWRDLVHGHGLNAGSALALHPEASVGDVSMSKLKRWKISEIIQKPQCILKGIIDDSVAPNEAFLHFPVSPGLSCHPLTDGGYLYFPTHMAYLQPMFRMWRGGIKFKIEFVTSRFTTARVQILHFPNAEVPPDLADYAGDTPSAIIDIRGNTTFEFTAPFLSPYPALPTTGMYAPGDPGTAQAVPFVVPHIAIALLNPVCIPDPGGNSTIYYSIWASAAEDFQFGHFDSYNPKQTSYVPPPSLDFTKSQILKEVAEKHSMDSAFQKPFPTLVPAMAQVEQGFVFPEQYDSINDLTHRFAWEWWGIPVSLPTYIPLSPATRQVMGNTPLGVLSKLFQFYRGSQNFKISGPLTETTESQYYFQPGDYSDTGPMRIMFSGKNPTLDVTVPWDEFSYCRPIYWTGDIDGAFIEDRVTLWDSYLQIDNTTTPLYDRWVFRATGEDFMFGSLGPCPYTAVV